MTEIMAVIQPTKLNTVKNKLIEVGFPGYTCRKAMGRGKKSVNRMLPDGTYIRTELVNKRVLSIMVRDDAVDKVVNAILDGAHTGNPGDGKIFISPVYESYKVRTGSSVDE